MPTSAASCYCQRHNENRSAAISMDEVSSSPADPPCRGQPRKSRDRNFLLTFAPSSHQFKIGPLRFRYGYLYWTYNSTALPSVLAGNAYGTSFACASSNRRKAQREKSPSSKKLAYRKVQHSPKRNSPGHDSCRWSLPGTMPADAQSRLAATGTNWLLSCF